MSLPEGFEFVPDADDPSIGTLTYQGQEVGRGYAAVAEDAAAAVQAANAPAEAAESLRAAMKVKADEVKAWTGNAQAFLFGGAGGIYGYVVVGPGKAVFGSTATPEEQTAAADRSYLALAAEVNALLQQYRYTLPLDIQVGTRMPEVMAQRDVLVQLCTDASNMQALAAGTYGVFG